MSETFSQMMGKSESGLAEPHEQEHLAILALAGCALGAKRVPPRFGSGRASELGNALFYVRKRRADVCQQERREPRASLILVMPKIILS